MSTEFFIRLADVSIHACCIYPSTKRFCEDYLIDKAIADTDTVSIIVGQPDINRERLRAELYDKKHGQETRQWSSEYLETLALYRKIAEKLIERDILLFHGSAISVDGNSYLFTAPSGTGKSTHARLWQEMLEKDHDVKIINDDKPLIRFTDNGIYVYGTPWDGKHRRSENTCAPLKAIGCIVQSETNHAERKYSDLWQVLLGQSYRSEQADGVKHSIALLERLVKEVPFYEIKCNMDLEAAECSWKVMGNDSGAIK